MTTALLAIDLKNQFQVSQYLFKAALKSDSTKLLALIQFFLMYFKDHFGDDEVRVRVAFLIATHSKLNDYFVDKFISDEMIEKCSKKIQDILKIPPTEKTPHKILSSIQTMFESY